jgi:hypothetical protein
LPLKELALGAGIVTLGSALALLDYRLFFWAPELAYTAHHLLAVVVGGTLVAVSWKLLGRTAGYRNVLLLDLLVGVGMIVIHVTKLVWGRCS